MAYVNIDTRRLLQNSKRIKELSREYESIISDMFSKIDLTLKNNWGGQASDNYRNNLRLEKDFFLKLSTYLNEYGKNLEDFSEDIDNKIRKCERD